MHCDSVQSHQYGGHINRDTQNRVAAIIVGLALTAIAGVATYFCIIYGLPMLDTATTSLSRFGAGFLLYSAVAFSVVGAGNAVYTGGKLLCSDESFEYSAKEATMQVGISVLAPVAAIPAIICLGLAGAAGAKC